MKRFLIFCVALIVTISLGFMVYYFTMNNEGISVDVTTYKLNIDENQAIDLNVVNAKNGTKVYFDCEKEGIVEFEGEDFNWIMTAKKAGSTKVALRTSNENIPVISLDVFVGDGTTANPLFIKNQADLAKIGDTQANNHFKMSSSYKLLSDIALTANWKPIGNGSAFQGVFDGENHTITNMQISAVEGSEAGLFSKIGENGKVTNLGISGATINTTASKVGVIAGENNGTISNCVVGKGQIKSTVADALVGGVAGLNKTISSIATIYKCSSNVNIETIGFAGGITAVNEGAEVSFSHTYNDLVVKGVTVGGIVGKNDYGTTCASVVAGCYVLGSTIGTTGTTGAVVGTNVYNPESTLPTTEKSNKVYGNYYSNSVYAQGVGNFADQENAVFLSSDNELLKAGIYGVESKTYEELCDGKTYKLLYSAYNDEVIAWDFSNVWTMPSGGTPKLNNIGSFVSISKGLLTTPGLVQNVLALQNLHDGESVIIEQDLDLGGTDGTIWEPLNVKNVTLIGKKQENGQYPKIFNIKLANRNNAGLFATLDGVTIKNLRIENVFLDNAGFTGSEVNIGAIAGIVKDNSSIDSVSVQVDNFNLNVVQSLNNATINIGSIAGKNEGTIVNSNVAGANIAVSFDNVTKARTYVGGIAGALCGTTNAIDNCVASNLDVNVDNNGEGAIGGVAGFMTNTTRVVNCCVEDSNIVANKNYVAGGNGNVVGHYEAGIVGVVDGKGSSSRISNSAVNNVKITGFAVGGIVASTCAVVEQCYVNAELTGFRVGGVASYQFYETSRISNVRVDGKLFNTDVSFNLGRGNGSGANKAGVVNISTGSDGNIPEFSNVFVNCYFADDGKTNYRTTSSAKDNKLFQTINFSMLYVGEEKNIIVNKDKCANARMNEKATSPLDFIIGTEFSVYETTNQKMANGDYSVFSNHGFSVERWGFDQKVPKVLNVNDQNAQSEKSN